MLLNLIALATLAVVASVSPQPTNALSVESHNFVRNTNVARHHSILSKRSPRKSCKAPAAGTPNTNTTEKNADKDTEKDSSKGNTDNGNKPSSGGKSDSSTKDNSKPTTDEDKPKDSKPPAPPSGGGGNPGSRKACVAYVGNVNVPKFVAGSNKIGCIINWSSWKPTWMNQIPGAQFVPMYWGPKQNSDFRKNVVSGFGKFVLGMNEPNQDGQSRMSPGEGVGYWKQYIQPLKWQGYTLVSPAPTNAPSGLTWLREFIDACDGCTVDHIATHWYGTESGEFIEHLKTYHGAFGRPIWVTEYACNDFSGRNNHCSRDKTFAFMETTQNFMDNTPWVFRYAWFGALHPQDLHGVNVVNRLINDDSSPNELGRRYLF